MQKLTDELTGIPNRRALDHFLSNRKDEPVGVVMANLDQFTAVNDIHGHPVGDLVLIEFARRIAAAAPPDGIAMRFGGNDFAVFLPGPGDMSTAQALSIVLLSACDTPVVVGDATIDLRLSAGIAIAPPKNPLAGLVAANTAMYEAKRRGGARAVCLDPVWEVS